MFESELKKLSELYEKGLFSKKYYSDRIDGNHSFSSYDEFCKIPIMYKQSIRDTSIFDRTNTSSDEIYGVFSSSGTTGAKTFYIYNNNDKKVHEEFVKTFFDELGITAEDIGGVMAPVGTGVMAHTMMWQFNAVGAGYVNCPEPSPENVIDIIENVPVSVIATRPNIVSTIAYFPDLTKKAQKSSVKKLALGGGFLSKERRKLLERTWDAQCYNCFGMSEMFGPMAAECKKKNGLHYLNQYLMIELLDPITKEPVPEGMPGIAVYTTLWEKGFPLLRYWTDDLMILDKTTCDCGSEYPRLFYLGRLADCFKSGSSYIFPEQVEDILFRNDFIGEYKVISENGSYTVITETDPGQDTSKVLNELRQLFECDTVEINMVPHGSLNYKGFGNRFETR